jgi:hypothetical protein
MVIGLPLTPLPSGDICCNQPLPDASRIWSPGLKVRPLTLLNVHHGALELVPALPSLHPELPM